MSEFKIVPVPQDKQQGWVGSVQVEKGRVFYVRLENPRFGSLEYGERPEGYDAWAFREVGGGGAVVLPFARHDTGLLYVGLRQEERSNMAGTWLCAIGGFKDPGEGAKQAAVRETAEEAGLDATQSAPLEGLPLNTNRAFWVADPAKDEGIHCFALEVPWSWLEWRADERFGLRAGKQDPNLPKPETIVFLPWRTAVKETPDLVAAGAIARLIVAKL